jgi:hypothetical protein
VNDDLVISVIFTQLRGEERAHHPSLLDPTCTCHPCAPTVSPLLLSPFHLTSPVLPSLSKLQDPKQSTQRWTRWTRRGHTVKFQPLLCRTYFFPDDACYLMTVPRSRLGNLRSGRDAVHV